MTLCETSARLIERPLRQKRTSGEHSRKRAVQWYCWEPIVRRAVAARQLLEYAAQVGKTTQTTATRARRVQQMATSPGCKACLPFCILHTVWARDAIERTLSKFLIVAVTAGKSRRTNGHSERASAFLRPRWRALLVDQDDAGGDDDVNQPIAC